VRALTGATVTPAMFVTPLAALVALAMVAART
jgi:hypothetical protein